MSEVILIGKQGSRGEKNMKLIGASKNGKKWQIELYCDKKKQYLGQVNDQTLAVRCFDVC
jgi:hypothetical protein